MAKRQERPTVGRDRMVAEEPGNDLPQPGPLFGDRPVQPPTQFLLDLREFRLHAVPAGLPLEEKISPAGFAADESETQEIEGLRFASPALPTPGRRVATKLDQASLLRMQRQREHLQSRSHLVPEA